MQLFAIVVRCGFVDLGLDLLDASFDLLGIAVTFHDRGVVLVDRDAFGAAEIGQLHVLELDADVFRNYLAAGKDCDIFQHGLAAITEARSFDGYDIQGAAQLVDHEGGQCFTFDFFRQDDERLAHLGHLLEQRQQILHAADLLFVDQDERLFHGTFHPLGIRDEVRRNVAAIELHAFDHVQ